MLTRTALGKYHAENEGVPAPGMFGYDGSFIGALSLKRARTFSSCNRLLINGSQVSVKGKIRLNQANKTDVFFIDGGTVIAHVAPRTGTVGFWKFPSGGNPTKILPNAPHEKGFVQNGIAVSLAMSK